MAKTDRRVERTRELLQKALIELTRERGYEAITIQDIADRANAGRTSFYLHYRSKDDLFMSCHESIVSEFQSGPLYSHPLSREELLSPEPRPTKALAYRHLAEADAAKSHLPGQGWTVDPAAHPRLERSGHRSQLARRLCRDRQHHSA